jgi:RNA polymerase sigma-70 factor, ECF subfamily
MDGGPSDEELVRRAREGDADAQRALFERHERPLRARVRRRLPASVRVKLAESDVLQEAYLAAFRSLGAFEDRGEGSFSRWLGGIVEHRVREAMRRFRGTKRRAAQRETSLSRADETPAARNAVPSPSRVAASAEERAAVVEAMAGLADDHRTVLRLVHEDGLKLVDAAAAMGRSPDAVRMLYGRAVAALVARTGRRDRAGRRG